jgi:AAA15 family ATPase/GTPase
MFAEHPKNNLLDNIDYPNNSDIGILRSAVIYGANASGKSNVLLAFKALKYLISESHTFKESKDINCYEPFLLAEDSQSKPVEFALEFIIPGNYRYIYQISYNKKEIITESLDFYPSRSKANIFDRKSGDSWETVSFGGRYKGGSKKIPFFKNNSYLSKAGNSAAAPKMIRRVYDYFTKFLTVSSDFDMPLGEIYSHDKMLALTSNMLAKVDVGISNISKEENDLSTFGVFPTDMPKHVKDSFISLNKYNFFFHHKDEKGKDVKFEASEESDGTRKLFSMLPAVTSTLKLGNILIIDELENSFHPHIAEMIVKLFNDPETNINNAQLIFTTHNVELMSPRLFRRDQIWFTSKKDGESRLYSLDEFDKATVTASSPFGDWYSDGRFGAIPMLKYQEIRTHIIDSLDLHEDKIKAISATVDEEE